MPAYASLLSLVVLAAAAAATPPPSRGVLEIHSPFAPTTAASGLPGGHSDREALVRQGFRLIETAPGERAWMAASEVESVVKADCGGWMDVTDDTAQLPDDELRAPPAFSRGFAATSAGKAYLQYFSSSLRSSSPSSSSSSSWPVTPDDTPVDVLSVLESRAGEPGRHGAPKPGYGRGGRKLTTAYASQSDKWDKFIPGLAGDAAPTEDGRAARSAGDLIEPVYADDINQLIPMLNKRNLYDTVKSLSSFPTRHFASKTGNQDAPKWLLAQARRATAGTALNVSHVLFKHKFQQPSIIVQVVGSERPEEVVVLGAHLDSINTYPFRKGAPGADDDASGCATVLEVLRVIAQSGYVPRRTVEFMFFANEETGLRGSQDIAGMYQCTRTKVVGMLQLDMTAYNGGPLGVATDYTSPALAGLVRGLIHSVGGRARRDFACKYACSDHASFSRVGFPAVILSEAELAKSNPSIHSSHDTIQKLDFDHAMKIARVALGFVVEMSH